MKSKRMNIMKILKNDRKKYIIKNLIIELMN